MATNKPTPLASFAKRPAAHTPAETPADSQVSAPGEASAAPVAEEKMRQKVFRLTPAQDRKLKEFCAHSDKSIQDVVMEGINLVLKAKGLPPI